MALPYKGNVCRVKLSENLLLRYMVLPLGKHLDTIYRKQEFSAVIRRLLRQIPRFDSVHCIL